MESEGNKAVYLSIVVVGRNDNYGGDFEARLQNFLEHIAEQTNRYSLPTELIFVNYNPIEDQPSLVNRVHWPDPGNFLTIRFLTVPGSVHQIFVREGRRKEVPLFEYIAKNAGIRRCRGDFILAANPDIVLHDSIFRYLSDRKLRDDCFYRVDRCDFQDLSNYGVVRFSNEFSAFFRKVFQIHFKGFTRPVQGGKAFRWKYHFLRFWNELVLAYELLKGKFPDLAESLGLNVVVNNIEYKFHCNASGDFFLMHRKHWNFLRGYPENTYLSLHTDSLQVIRAGALGIKEVVLPWPVFHKDHGRRYDSSRGKHTALMNEVYRSFQEKGKEMLQTGVPFIPNDSQWGCAPFSLSEKLIPDQS